MNWTGWTLERFLVLFVAIAYLLIGVQVTMSHYRQNFHHKAMWAPVVASPIFTITGLMLAMARSEWLFTLFALLMWVAIVAGLGGFYYHFHGVRVRVGGWAPRNFLVGPPVIQPLLFSAVGALGLAAVYWG